MRDPKKMMAVFFALLIACLQIGFGNIAVVEETGDEPAAHGSVPTLTNQTSSAYTFSDQRQSFQSLIERIFKSLSKIKTPGWFRNNLSVYFDQVESCDAYMASVPMLPYKHEVPLIGFPFHNFW